MVLRPPAADATLRSVELDAVADDHVTLTAFAGYFEGAPKNAGLIFRVVPDDTMRGLELGRMPVPDGREMRIYAQLGEADRTGLDDVRSMTFLTDSGVEVPLEAISW